MFRPYTRQGRPVQPTAQSASLMASVGGVNALDSLMGMPINDAIFTFNLMPVEYGMQLRRGYQAWATGLQGDVRTIVPYDSSQETAGFDKLFGVTEYGIYDISSPITGGHIATEDGICLTTEEGDEIVDQEYVPPVALVDFADQTDPSGYGVVTEWTTDASEHYLFYADGQNGLYQYTESLGWEVPSGWTYDPGSGSTAFPVEDVAFIASHKLRLWVILKDSDDAYYSDVASVAGDFTKFTFGAKMPHGGWLQGLYTWSIDGGNGMDDYLVGISRGGDVLVYQGSDPTQPDWQMVGSWFIGETPKSRRIAMDYGSDMYILSVYGITSLRDLLQGTVAEIYSNSPSAKVNRFLRTDVSTGLDRYEWSLTTYPGDGFLQVITPEPANTPYIQYCQTLSTKAWGFWEGVPMICGASWLGDYYMGGVDGEVYLYDGTLDGTNFCGFVGDPINFRTLTSFQPPNGNRATNKRAGVVRTIGLRSGSANMRPTVVYDYNINPMLPTVLPAASTGASLWGSAVWGLSVWGGTTTDSAIKTGVSGMGRVMAIGLVGSSSVRLTVVGWDITFVEGGLM